MSAARDRTLAAIRETLTHPPGPSSDRRLTSLSAASPLSSEQLLELFLTRAAAYGATVTTCSADTTATMLREACARNNAQRLAIPSGLQPQLRPDGVELVADHGLSVPELDKLDGVITGAAVAIAESGTIALDGSPDQGRRVLTLIPDLHLCVVYATQLVPTLPDALELLAGPLTNGHRPIILVSGPSATSDIELSRVQGVHGPRRLEILVVTDTEPTR